MGGGFEIKKAQYLVVKSDGIEVFYGNEITLVNSETGKRAWGKPIVLDDIFEDDKGDVIKKDYANGTFAMGS